MDRVLKHDKRKSLSGYALDSSHTFMPTKNGYLDDSNVLCDSLVPKSASDSDEYAANQLQSPCMRRHRSLPGERYATNAQQLQRPQRSQVSCKN